MTDQVFDGTAAFMVAAGQLSTSADGSIVGTGFSRSYDNPVRSLRRHLLEEEVDETLIAEGENDPVEVADGLADVIVIAIGSLLAYFGEECAAHILAEVARSNLSKVVDGKVLKRWDGKILKPDTYSPPDIRSILKDYGFVE